MMTFEDIVREARALPVTQRKRLITLIVDSLADEPAEVAKTHNILEFEGIASQLADDEDPQDYVNRLRSEWDDRP